MVISCVGSCKGGFAALALVTLGAEPALGWGFGATSLSLCWGWTHSKPQRPWDTAGRGQAGESPALPRAVFALIRHMSSSLSIRKPISTFELSVRTQISTKSVIFALLETLNLLFLRAPNFRLFPRLFPFFSLFSQELM